MSVAPQGHRLGCGTVVVCFLGMAAVATATNAPAPTPSAPFESSIVFAQIPSGRDVENRPGRAEGTLRADYGEGSRIVRLDSGDGLLVLTEGFSSACDPAVSFDGERILFAGKRDPLDAWNIWEMNADGSGARQVTRDAGNCRNPAYQATLYTIVSTEPWYQIMYVSDAAGAMNECGSSTAMSLYSCKLDGGGVRRLTMNLSDDMDPFLMDDGRVLLAGWQRMDLRRGRLGRVALFGVNTDGADYALFCGDQGRRVKHMPCVTIDGPAVFVEADRVGWDGAGQLGAVTLRRNFYSYKPITHDEKWLYHSPSPLPDGSVLVSKRPASKPLPPPAEVNTTHGVYRFNPRSGRSELIFDDPQYHDIHAKVLAPRREPDGRSSVVNEKYPTGIFYCLNAYLTDPGIMPHVRPGMIHSLRVLEGVPLSVDEWGRCGPKPAARFGMSPVVQKRLLGQVPVESDGSFNIELPADVPVQLQTLDENGMALRSCGWIWVKHREPRGCIGCHEDPELVPENRFVQAVRRESMKLTLPPEKRRTVDFRRDVMPIITAKCACCHAGDTQARSDPQRTEGLGRRGEEPDGLKATPSRLDLSDRPAASFNQAYVTLSTLSTQHSALSTQHFIHVTPGQARTSPLIWRLYGRNTSRPWDDTYVSGQAVPTCPPVGAEQLTDDEKLMFVEWIDLGAHWDGIPGSAGFSTGCGGGTRK